MEYESARALLWQLEGLAKALPHANRLAVTLARSALGPAGAQALEAGLQKLQRFPLSTRMLREVHAILLGLEALPHMQAKTQHALDDIMHAVHEPTSRPLVTIARTTSRLETLAPFHDGNKRMRTIFVALLGAHFELLTQPFLLLKAASDGTVEGFVTQVVECAITTQQQIKQLLVMREKHKQLLVAKRAPLRALQVLEFMQMHPSVRVQDVAGELGVPYQSAANLVAQLQKFELVKEVTGQKRERRFVYKPS